ncbi:MAG: DUF3568 domain-containing protein [Syntrophobacterales bacterium]|nr:DUF3568 domain-containing protein [Syntrophobacterales bacterium]
MKRKLSGLFIAIAAFLLLFGCDTALTVGSKTVGIRSGSFLYEDGYLRTTYHSQFETVWAACEKTLAGLKATDIERIRKISQGSFTGLLMDEKIRINVDYVEKGTTAVSVMAGTTGNKIAAQLIHDRLAENLKTP